MPSTIRRGIGAARAWCARHEGAYLEWAVIMCLTCVAASAFSLRVFATVVRRGPLRPDEQITVLVVTVLLVVAVVNIVLRLLNASLDEEFEATPAARRRDLVKLLDEADEADEVVQRARERWERAQPPSNQEGSGGSAGSV